jgi:hypothetical protein
MVLSAAVEKAFLEAFDARPAASPCEANRIQILNWLTETLRPTDSYNMVRAIDVLMEEGKIAATVSETERAHRLKEMIEGPAPAPVVAPQPTEQEQLKALQRALRSTDPQVVAAATAELKSRANKESKIDRFNRLYTKRGLANMGKLELDAVVRIYGAELVSNRLNS